MGRVKDVRLFELFRAYFTVYLPRYRNASEHTIRAYRSAMDSFLDFLKERNNISVFDITFSMFEHRALQSFVDYLRDEKGNSQTTCNHRIACVKAFLRYCAEEDPSTTVYYAEAGAVSAGKAPTNSGVDYLSEKAVRLLIDQPDPSTSKGQRDMFFMILLYDTGARVEELLGAKICDVKLGTSPTITLFGKGRKFRSVPLTERTVRHYQQYLKRFHPDETEYSQEYIFYTIRDGMHHKMTSDTVRVFMRQYGLAARKYLPEIPENVHPHLFRHSRAMHLYQGGMDLTLVSQWLGHVNLQTTLVYAYADTEKKRKAIEQATSSDNPSGKNTSTGAYTVDDEETLKKLYGLK